MKKPFPDPIQYFARPGPSIIWVGRTGKMARLSLIGLDQIGGPARVHNRADLGLTMQAKGLAQTGPQPAYGGLG